MVHAYCISSVLWIHAYVILLLLEACLCGSMHPLHLLDTRCTYLTPPAEVVGGEGSDAHSGHPLHLPYAPPPKGIGVRDISKIKMAHRFYFWGFSRFWAMTMSNLPRHYQILSIHTLESGKSGLKNGFACIFVKKHKSLEFHKASILFFRRKSLSGEIMFL